MTALVVEDCTHANISDNPILMVYCKGEVDLDDELYYIADLKDELYQSVSIYDNPAVDVQIDDELP